MDNFSYFHLCDHQIKKSVTQGQTVTILVKSSGNPVDMIINGAVVMQVLEVRAVQYDSSIIEIADFYYDNIDNIQTYDDTNPANSYYDDQASYLINYGKYFEPGASISNPLPEGLFEPFLHNRLKWTVKPPITYQVTANVRYTGDQYQRYSPNECPLCGGKGWFIDLLNKDGAFIQPVGIIKVAQRVVKDFLTELGSSIFDSTYGQRVRDDLVNYASDDAQLFDFIRLAVSSVEDNYLNNQQNVILTLPPDEILTSLSVDDVYRNPNKMSMIILQLRIITSTEDQVLQVGF